MSVWQHSSGLPILHTPEGDLLSVRVTVEAFLLEDLLDTLCEAPFPINPAITHHAELFHNGHSVPAVHVDFPVWHSWVPELRTLLARRGLDAGLTVTSMIEEIRA